jgi:hypothetical protein
MMFMYGVFECFIDLKVNSHVNEMKNLFWLNVAFIYNKTTPVSLYVGKRKYRIEYIYRIVVHITVSFHASKDAFFIK